MFVVFCISFVDLVGGNTLRLPIECILRERDDLFENVKADNITFEEKSKIVLFLKLIFVHTRMYVQLKNS